MNKYARSSGWGNVETSFSKILQADKVIQNTKKLHNIECIAQGSSQSYGDSALSNTIIDFTKWNNFYHFDKNLGFIDCESGCTVQDILNLTIKDGWILPVIPGSSKVTIGGAIASDVHGKNHHLLGTFTDHIKSIRLMVASGEILTISSDVHPQLFRATCSGMGLTGLILSAQIKLLPIKSDILHQRISTHDSLNDLIQNLTSSTSDFKVAWIDPLFVNKRQHFRCLLFENEFKKVANLTKKVISNPFQLPRYSAINIWNPITKKVFNELYFNFHKDKKSSTTVGKVLFPTEYFPHLNSLCGRFGLIQCHLVLPQNNAVEGIRTILNIIREAKEIPLLISLKHFGKANSNDLSFPISGISVAIDFRASTSALLLQSKVIDHVISLGGRIYLTKDSTLDTLQFKKCYPNWERFQETREAYGAYNVFVSQQSKRFGLN